MGDGDQTIGTTRGLFVSIEGVEGAGKSTLAAALRRELASRGLDVVVTAEPGGDAVARKIRKVLLDSANVISDRAELLLFEAARAQHVETVIVPALSRGAVVICDRYADSSVAYQGWARGQDVSLVETLNDYATGGLKPDLTILLDLPARAGLARQRKVDRLSSERLAFHEAVRKGFLSLAQAEPERFVVIDAALSLDEVIRLALEAVQVRLP